MTVLMSTWGSGGLDWRYGYVFSQGEELNNSLAFALPAPGLRRCFA